jgi:hypothetical protein
MKARRLIEGGSFDHQTLKVVCEAFDAAWDEIAWSVNKTEPVAVEAARLCLADAVLSVAHEEARDAEEERRARSLGGQIRYRGSAAKIGARSHVKGLLGQLSSHWCASSRG